MCLCNNKLHTNGDKAIKRINLFLHVSRTIFTKMPHTHTHTHQPKQFTYACLCHQITAWFVDLSCYKRHIRSFA